MNTSVLCQEFLQGIEYVADHVSRTDIWDEHRAVLENKSTRSIKSNQHLLQISTQWNGM
jgi:hypothetical protein